MSEDQPKSDFPPSFDQIVDHYNENIQALNLLRKSKNEELKKTQPSDKEALDSKYKPKIDSYNLQLKTLISEFSIMANEILTNYMNSNNNDKILMFPPKLIGEFRKIIHDIADKLGLLHESVGSGANRKLTLSKIITELPKKKSKIDEQSNNKSKKIEKLEFPPDEIDKIEVTFLKDDEITIRIHPSECYDNPIKGYMIYGPLNIDPDFGKSLYKIENSDKFSLKFRDYDSWASELIDKTSLNDKILLRFKLSAFNDYGESFLSHAFNILINVPRKAKIFVTGSCHKNKIPIQTLKLSIDTLSISGFKEIEMFSNQVYTMRSYDTSLLLLDNGGLVQWGLSICEDLEFKNKEKHRETQEGDMMNQMYSEPFLIDQKLIVNSISVGIDFCCLTSCLGEVYTWGYNQYGQLGHDDMIIRPVPTIINSLKGVTIVDISCGNQHCITLDLKGGVHVWGRKQAIIGQTQLFDRYGKTSGYQNLGVHQFKPRLIKEVLDYYKIIKISAGGFHNAVITEGKDLYVWGDNESGQLGLAELDAVNITVPRQMSVIENAKYKVSDVSCGGLHTLAVVEGNAWSWGDESQGQCGSGEKKALKLPEKIKALDGKEIVRISAGGFHSLVKVKEEGIYGFGFNGNGELGMKSQKKKVRMPIKIKGIPEGNNVEMVAGMEVSCLCMI